MSNKALNITNGDAFNRYFQEKFGGVAVPFREVMMDGDVVEDIFSCEFVRLRAKELNVSEETYRENMLLYDAMSGGEFFELCLWFGKDTFCQMNLRNRTMRPSHINPQIIHAEIKTDHFALRILSASLCPVAL